MTMMPPGVLTAHAEYSVWPTKYRLSNTLTGLAYQVSRAGAPAALGVAGVVRGAGGAGGVHNRVASAAYSDPAAALAAATCCSTVPETVCAAAAASAAAIAMNMPARIFISTSPQDRKSVG